MQNIQIYMMQSEIDRANLVEEQIRLERARDEFFKKYIETAQTLVDNLQSTLKKMKAPRPQSQEQINDDSRAKNQADAAVAKPQMPEEEVEIVVD
jgi:hypothetical protein